MAPNTLLFGLLGVAIGILAVWILTVRYRSNARLEAANIVEYARKEASVDRKQQIAEAALEIKQERQDLAQDIQRLRSELTERERYLAVKETAANETAHDLEGRLEQLTARDEDLGNREKSIEETSAEYRAKLEEVAQLNPEAIRKRLEEEVHQEFKDELRAMRRVCYPSPIRRLSVKLNASFLPRCSESPVRRIPAMPLQPLFFRTMR